MQNEQDLNVPLHLNDQELTAWLARNREALRKGKAVFNGVPINYETELTRFVRVTGLVYVCLRQYSRFFVCGVEPFDAVARAYTCHSLLFGWWAIPWGPIRTVQAIKTNSSGGMRTRVLDLIGNDTNDVVTLTEREFAGSSPVSGENLRGQALFPVYGAFREVTGRFAKA